MPSVPSMPSTTSMPRQTPFGTGTGTGPTRPLNPLGLLDLLELLLKTTPSFAFITSVGTTSSSSPYE